MRFLGLWMPQRRHRPWLDICALVTWHHSFAGLYSPCKHPESKPGHWGPLGPEPQPTRSPSILSDLWGPAGHQPRAGEHGPCTLCPSASDSLLPCNPEPPQGAGSGPGPDGQLCPRGRPGGRRLCSSWSPRVVFTVVGLHSCPRAVSPLRASPGRSPRRGLCHHDRGRGWSLQAGRPDASSAARTPAEEHLLLRLQDDPGTVLSDRGRQVSSPHSELIAHDWTRVRDPVLTASGENYSEPSRRARRAERGH